MASSPIEVAEKMMKGQFDSPEEWLSMLESFGVRLEPTGDTPGDTPEDTPEDVLGEEPEPRDPPDREPEDAGPEGPPLAVIRMRAAKNALRKGGK